MFILAAFFIIFMAFSHTAGITAQSFVMPKANTHQAAIAILVMQSGTGRNPQV